MEKCPLHFFKAQRRQSAFDTPGPSRPHRWISSRNAGVEGLCPDEMAPWAPRLSCSSWEPPSPDPGARNRASVEAARRRALSSQWAATRPGPERCSPRAASVLGAGPTTATLGLSPPGPGCPFRPASLPAPAPRLALSPRLRARRKAASGRATHPTPGEAAPRRTALGPGRPDSPHQIAEPQTHSRHLTTQPPPTHGRSGTSGRSGAAHWSEAAHVMRAGRPPGHAAALTSPRP